MNEHEFNEEEWLPKVDPEVEKAFRSKEFVSIDGGKELPKVFIYDDGEEN